MSLWSDVCDNYSEDDDAIEEEVIYPRTYERVNSTMFRLAVPGGWLVSDETMNGNCISTSFIIDPEHQWKFENGHGAFVEDNYIDPLNQLGYFVGKWQPLTMCSYSEPILAYCDASKLPESQKKYYYDKPGLAVVEFDDVASAFLYLNIKTSLLANPIAWLDMNVKCDVRLHKDQER